MAQSLRQSELLAGNDWTLIYKAFSQINFNAYDFNSVRQSMTDYIRLNYPENFNDWIDSSEFVAIIDLISYLGESLAFRIDINARENFIDTARRRESILRLARFLSYNPQRNHASQGLVKILQISTTEDVYDSSGNNLNNQTIIWNDPINSNWFEQWILVMNSAYITTNPFGIPLKQATLGSVDTQIYRLNSVPTGAGNYPFTSFVDGDSLNFDICNADFSTTEGFKEIYPNPQAAFQMIYQNDGNGNSSVNTGFFMLFKQGVLQRSDVTINEPLENRIIYINTQDINQNDVWVQSVNDGGFIVNNGLWTRVGYVPTDNLSKILVNVDNVTYNSVSPNIQNIYQVVTQENDQIMLRFGDGRFGRIPVGNLRIWYRVSANKLISIRPEEMQNIQINIPYLSATDKKQNLILNFSLQTTVANGTISESNADIARRAGLNYSTQARMVSGNDYNILPSTNNLALKVKAVNRIYSGQSRYIDLNDPTGTYQNTNVFSDDGALYLENNSIYNEIPVTANLSTAEIVSSIIMPQLNNLAVRNFLINEWLTTSNPLYSIFKSSPSAITWTQSTNQTYSTTGYFLLNNAIAHTGDAAAVDSIARYILPGSLLKFTNAKWVSVIRVDQQNTTGLNANTQEGAIQLSQDVLTGDTLIEILPAFYNTLNSSNVNQIIQLLDDKRTFGISYNFQNRTFNFIDVANLNINDPYNFTGKFTTSDTSWIIRCDYSPANWRIVGRGLQYVFESNRDVKFFFLNKYKTIDIITGKTVQDTVKILKYNGLPSDYSFFLEDNYTYSDGYIEPRRVMINYTSVLNEGQPDNPESFIDIIPSSSLVFHKKSIDQNGYEYYSLFTVSSNSIISNMAALPVISADSVIYRLPQTGDITQGVFYLGSNAGIAADYKVNHGRSALSFQWKHYVPIDQRIDPAVSNIIDIYILQLEFYNLMLTWRTNGFDKNHLPQPPTENTLRLAFSELEQFKMFSDEIVWRPIKFKLLFGDSAAPALRVTFKVVPLLGTLVSNGEIKSRVVAAINNFFNVSSWDFGETFYYSELGSYLHAQLVDCIASIVPVPTSSTQSFGDLFEIRCNPDELFFPTVQVKDINIISANTSTNLRIK